MVQDRMPSNSFALTHEVLSLMLRVRAQRAVTQLVKHADKT